MDRIHINGGNRLKGKIKISGSKNSALPILAATLLTDKSIKLNNVPNLSDVSSMINLLESLNVIVSKKKKILMKLGPLNQNHFMHHMNL